jgi:hypothetical protein
MAKKSNGLLKQAKKLGKSKYSPALSSVAHQRKSNRQSYDTASQQRIAALNAEMGSLEAADKATKDFLGNLKSQSGNLYQQAMLKSQQANTTAQVSRQQDNSQLLSKMQASAVARGLSDSTAANMSTKLSSNNEILTGVGEMNRGAIERMGLISQGSIDTAGIGESMVVNSSKSSARGAATSSLDKLYSTYQAERSNLEGETTKLRLEKQDYINQLYMTLKDKAKAEKAAKAQASMQASIAAGNLSFKNTKLKIDTQLSYDKLASDTAYKDVLVKLKKQGFKHKQALELAKLALQARSANLADRKFNWTMANPKASASANLDAIWESLNK